LVLLAGVVVAFAEVVVRGCLLVGLPGFGGQLERRCELGAGGGGLPSGVQGLGEAAERLSLAGVVADFCVHRECLPDVADGLLVVALAQADLTEFQQLGGDAVGVSMAR
jgi:hypothetical protein